MVRVCPTPFFCMNEHTFYLILGITIVTVAYVYNVKQNTSIKRKGELSDINGNGIGSVHDPIIGETQFVNPFLKNAIITNDMETHRTLTSKDYERTMNPLLPPERSYPYRKPDIRDIRGAAAINVPTRGEAGTYSQVGTLTAPDETNPTVLPLYGKPTYPGSQHWLYYTSTDKLPTVKLPLKLNGKDCLGEPGCKEINGGENINVPAYASKEFTVDIYKMDTPRYIPIV